MFNSAHEFADRRALLAGIGGLATGILRMPVARLLFGRLPR
jgi:hypothetical protein